MKHHAIIPLLAAALALGAGCHTVNSRIMERPATFARLDPATQEKIKEGVIEIGYTEDMVYIALGNPDQKRETSTENGKSTTWIYNTYYDRYDGTFFAGYHRGVYYDPASRVYRIYTRPVYADTYRQEKAERIRVIFKDGRATAIEQSSD